MPLSYLGVTMAAGKGKKPGRAHKQVKKAIATTAFKSKKK